VVGGLLIVAAWLVGAESFVASVRTKVNAGVGFVAAGLWLLLAARGAVFKRSARAIAVFLAILGLLTAVEYVAGVDLRIDQLIAIDPTGEGLAPGRMAPGTAFAFFFIGVAAASVSRVRLPRLLQGLGAVVGLIGIVAITGYAYGVQVLYGIAAGNVMSVWTAMLLLILALGMLTIWPDVGVTALVLDDGIAGSTARRLLPVVFITPLFMGWVRLVGVRAGLYGPEVGASLLVLAMVVTLTAVILTVAHSLNTIDAGVKHMDATLEQRVAEKTDQLSRSAANFRALLDSAPDAMVIVDRLARIVLVNARTEELFGYSRNALLGQPVDMLMAERIDDADPQRRVAHFARLQGRGLGSDLELFALRADGSRFPIEIRMSPIRSDEGVLLSAAIRDITERKRLEARTEEASRLKSEFLANMSHELRTPLNAIIGFAAVMRKGTAGPLNDDQREYLEDILTSGNHLLQLINDVLDLAKIESGTMELRPESVEPARLLAEVRDVVHGLAASKQLRLDITVDPDLEAIVVDPARVKQILFNYLSNAIKFTPEGGRVEVRLAAEGHDSFRLEVKDTGVGIAPEHLDKLFTEFVQLDAGAAKHYQGTGLGLAITKRVAHAHGGRVFVQSAPGQGSTFGVVLPRQVRVERDTQEATPKSPALESPVLSS
jgi:protein-histidine pros-kinase